MKSLWRRNEAFERLKRTGEKRPSVVEQLNFILSFGIPLCEVFYTNYTSHLLMLAAYCFGQLLPLVIRDLLKFRSKFPSQKFR